MLPVRPDTGNVRPSAAEANVVYIGPRDEDGAFLERVFHDPVWNSCAGCEWTFIAACSVASAGSILRERAASIVICEADISSGSWRDLLAQLSSLSAPPLLIMTSRIADERLWAETLNLGGWDVLAKPFDRSEVIRTVSSAWQHWQARHDVGRARRGPSRTGGEAFAVSAAS